MPRKPLVVGSLLLAAADVFSKYLVFAVLGAPNYANPHDFAVIPGFFYFTTRYNPGFSWGMFSGIPWLLSAFINLLIMLAVGYIFLFTRKIPVNRWTIATGILILGGALGNLYDRLFFSEHMVRDFLDFIIPVARYDYPVFNLADVFIVVGVIIALAEPYLARRSSGKAKDG